MNASLIRSKWGNDRCLKIHGDPFHAQGSRFALHFLPTVCQLKYSQFSCLSRSTVPLQNSLAETLSMTIAYRSRHLNQWGEKYDRCQLSFQPYKYCGIASARYECILVAPYHQDLWELNIFYHIRRYRAYKI